MLTRFGRATACGLGMLAGLAIASAQQFLPAGPPSPREAVAPRPGDQGLQQAKPGPWGDLEYFPIYLEAPMSLVKLFPVPSQKPSWKFVGMGQDEITACLVKAGLSREQTDSLWKSGDWARTNDVTHLFPTRSMVESLTPDNRADLYRVLRQWPANPFHNSPLVIESGSVADWYNGSGLRPELVAVIDKLSYPWANGRAFSDVSILLQDVVSEEEQFQVIKSLTRTRSLLLRLRLDSSSDPAALKRYWAAFGRRKDIQPMIEAVIETRGVDTLDVVHLLPPMARRLLYSYPDPAMGTAGAFPDCHWSTFNFFRQEPLDRFLDPAAVVAHLNANYELTEAPLEFGDVLFFVNEANGDAFHSAVYVADDIVFTKNGETLSMPWIFMRMGDLRARYEKDYEYAIRAYRLNQ